MEEENKLPAEETEEAQEILLSEPDSYRPRPAYKVWAARIGLVIVIIAVILYYYHIAKGGL